MSYLRSVVLLSLFLISTISRGQSCDSLFITLSTGIWAEEVSWSISDLDGVVVASDGVYQDSTSYDFAFCLPVGCYHLNMFDSFGDGWQGAVLEIWNADGILQSMGDLPNGLEGVVDFGFNVNCGCTDSAASNYDPAAELDDGNCDYCFGDWMHLVLNTGIWANEVSWTITDMGGQVVAEDGVFENNSYYDTTLCVPTGCLQLNLFDSFGDGWQGASIELWNSAEELVASGNLSNGFEESHSFSSNTVCGCTDVNAYNYNEGAESDDGSCAFCDTNELLVVLTTGDYGNELIWHIADDLGNVLFEGQDYPSNILVNIGICLPEGCYTIHLEDTFGDGWNGASFEIIGDLETTLFTGTVESGFLADFGFSPYSSCGCTDSSALNFDPAAELDDGSCLLCDQNAFTVELYSGNYGDEISWVLVDENSQEIIGGGDYPNQQVLQEFLCLPEGCFTLYLMDSFGDGWNEATLQITDFFGTVLLAATVESGYAASFSFSPYTICGCTDSQAINYDTEALTDDGTCLLCESPGNIISVELETGVWAVEVSWDVTNDLGEILFDGNGYFDYSAYQDLMCLEDGCYHLNLHDSYGDGWQGAVITLLNDEGVVLATGAVPPNEFEASYVFTVNGDCEIPGCTLPQSTNYNVWANVDDGSCSFISDNVELLGQWSDDSLELNGLNGRYTEVYGAAVNGREYGIIGSTAGTHIIDITVPENSEEVAFIPGAFSGSGVIHRDYHTYHNYLYAACQQGSSTLQIIDISNLPDTAIVVYDSDEIFSVTHNIFIDTTMSKLYAVSASGSLFYSPLLVIDIQNETQPELLVNMEGVLPGTHDIYVENDTAYINVMGNGLMVYDFGTQPPQLLGALSDYPDQGGNHSGWLDSERDVYVFADEIHGADLKVSDVSDLTDITVESTFNSDVDPMSIPHNLILRDNYVFLSYYHDGLQIFDISDPASPQKAGYYDTYLPNNHDGFRGAWGVYPLLPSGNVLISDIQSGLFVLGFTPDQVEICANDSLLIEGMYQNDPGVYVYSQVMDDLGYDDIVVVELGQLGVDYSEEWVELVLGDSLLVNGNYISQSGTYVDSLINMWGCDSLVTIHVDIVDNIADVQSSIMDVRVYPNPARGSFTIEFTNAGHKEYRFELMDAQGKLVKMIAGIRSDKILVQPRGLPSGMYFFRLVGKHETYSDKLLLEQ